MLKNLALRSINNKKGGTNLMKAGSVASLALSHQNSKRSSIKAKKVFSTKPPMKENSNENNRGVDVPSEEEDQDPSSLEPPESSMYYDSKQMEGDQEEEDELEKLREQEEKEILESHEQQLGDFANISKVMKGSEIPDTLAEGSHGGCFTIVYLLSVILLVISSITTFRVTEPHEIKEAFFLYALNLPFDSTGKFYQNLTSTSELNNYLSDTLLTVIYSKDNKLFRETNNDAHFISQYNRYMGGRLTYHKAKTEEVTVRDLTMNERLRNYQGRTGRKFDDLDKDDIVRTRTNEDGSESKTTLEYQDGGGHNGQGGFVIFLSDILNETEARDKYSQLTIEDTSNFTRKLEDNFLDLTFEVLLFNENYE